MEEIEKFVALQLHQLQLCPESLHSIATAEAKCDEAGLIGYAEKLCVPIKFYSSAELNQVVVPTPPSQHALDAIGATGVAEPAAILASEGGCLLLEKVKTTNVTLAVAELKQHQEVQS
jgi:cobalt-precorrin 5A hydrolase